MSFQNLVIACEAPLLGIVHPKIALEAPDKDDFYRWNKEWVCIIAHGLVCKADATLRAGGGDICSFQSTRRWGIAHDAGTIARVGCDGQQWSRLHSVCDTGVGLW